jgi:hypothetical protein
LIKNENKKKRDVIILGMFAFLVFEIIYNWDGSQQGFFG